MLGVTDDPGVMGNLPRARPGRRSAKRAAEVKPGDGGSKPPAKAKAKPAAAKATTAKSRTTKAKSSAAKPRAAKPKAAKPRPKTTRARAGGPAATTPSAAGKAPPTATRDERVEAPQGQDPITAALRLGMAVGDAGLKAVAKLAQRLPRP